MLLGFTSFSSAPVLIRSSCAADILLITMSLSISKAKKLLMEADILVPSGILFTFSSHKCFLILSVAILRVKKGVI